MTVTKKIKRMVLGGVVALVMAHTASAGAEETADPQPISIEYATLTVKPNTFWGLSSSFCTNAFYPRLGFRNAVCLGGQATVLFDRNRIGDASLWFMSAPVLGDAVWRVYLGPGTVSTRLGVGAIYAFQQGLESSRHALDFMGRWGVDLSVWKITAGVDVYLMEGNPVVFRLGWLL